MILLFYKLNVMKNAIMCTRVMSLSLGQLAEELFHRLKGVLPMELLRIWALQTNERSSYCKSTRNKRISNLRELLKPKATSYISNNLNNHLKYIKLFKTSQVVLIKTSDP